MNYKAKIEEIKTENMLKKIKHMLELQDELNKQINPDWKKQGFKWYRAIWVECAEVMIKLISRK